MLFPGTWFFYAMNILIIWIVFAMDYVTIGDAERVIERIEKKKKEAFRNGCNDCGLMNKNDKLQVIINGDNVTPPNKYPWMVSLETRGGRKVCGGAIISEYYIITAAHCLMADGFPAPTGKLRTSRLKSITDNPLPDLYVKPENMVVAFLTSTSETTPRSEVSEVIPHEEYDEMNHDIGLLRMKEKIKCDEFASPICLPNKGMLLSARSRIRLSGWGKSDVETEEGATTLQESKLKAMPFEDCSRINSDYMTLNDTYFCIQGEKESTPCYGDSGSSMFEEIGNKAYTVGVASMLTKLGCPLKVPMVFTSVSAHMSWIKQKLR